MSLWIAEHGRIYRGTHNEIIEGGNLQLASDDFDSVLSLLEDNEQSNLEPILKYSRSNGRDVLTVQQYVGVVRTESGCQIEILPKTAKQTTADQARQLLVRMLVELRNSPFKPGVLANLDAHKVPLYELLMRQFLEHVGDIVRRGIARSYVDQQDNLRFIRGKLVLREHIKRNVTDKSNVYCEFDEFEMDRPINRLIKGALEIVSRNSRDSTNRQHCREFLFWFDRVRATQDPSGDFRAIHHDRLIQHYQPAMPTCRLILQGLNPLTKQGANRTQSMLFPMNKVFEDYVSAKLRTQFKKWTVKSQAQSHSLVQNHVGSRIFQLKPDLAFKQGNRNLIGDTKWKLLNQDDRKGNYQISQADVYQLFAYAKKYLADQKRKEVLLIYPRTDRFDKPLEPFWFQESDEVLLVVPYDLEQDSLITAPHSMLFEDDYPTGG